MGEPLEGRVPQVPGPTARFWAPTRVSARRRMSERCCTSERGPPLMLMLSPQAKPRPLLWLPSREAGGNVATLGPKSARRIAWGVRCRKPGDR